MQKYAVIETGGKQYRVSEGDLVKIELLKGSKEGDKIDFDKVLLIDDSSNTKLGYPYLEGTKVSGVVEVVGRDKKISVIRFKSKSNYTRHYGHRQPFCKIRINSI